MAVHSLEQARDEWRKMNNPKAVQDVKIDPKLVNLLSTQSTTKPNVVLRPE